MNHFYMGDFDGVFLKVVYDTTLIKGKMKYKGDAFMSVERPFEESEDLRAFSFTFSRSVEKWEPIKNFKLKAKSEKVQNLAVHFQGLVVIGIQGFEKGGTDFEYLHDPSKLN